MTFLESQRKTRNQWLPGGHDTGNGRSMVMLVFTVMVMVTSFLRIPQQKARVRYPMNGMSSVTVVFVWSRTVLVLTWRMKDIEVRRYDQSKKVRMTIRR